MPASIGGAWTGHELRLRRCGALALVVTAAFAVADRGPKHGTRHARRSLKLQAVFPFDLAGVMPGAFCPRLDTDGKGH